MSDLDRFMKALDEQTMSWPTMMATQEELKQFVISSLETKTLHGKDYEYTPHDLYARLRRNVGNRLFICARAWHTVELENINATKV
jgi:hypothetical protein